MLRVNNRAQPVLQPAGQQQQGTTGAAGQQQGAAGVAGQQQGAATPAQIHSNLSFYPATQGQAPWYGNPGIKSQLNLTPEQYNNLNQIYSQHAEQYRKGQNFVGPMTAQEQAVKNGQLTEVFNSNVLQSAKKILNPTQAQRFQQLHMQSQGFNVFNSPSVQKQLNLTTQQTQTLQAYMSRLNTKLNDIPRSRANDPTAAAVDYNALQKENNEVLRSILNPTQLQSLQGIWGEPYNFPNGKVGN